MISTVLTIISGLLIGAILTDAYLRIRKISKQLSEIHEYKHSDVHYLLEQNSKNSARLRYIESDLSDLRHEVNP